MWQYNYTNPDELYHYGIEGMKWGYSYGVKNGLRTASTVAGVETGVADEDYEKTYGMSKKDLDDAASMYKKIQEDKISKSISKSDREKYSEEAINGYIAFKSTAAVSKELKRLKDDVTYTNAIASTNSVLKKTAYSALKAINNNSYTSSVDNYIVDGYQKGKKAIQSLLGK